MPRPKGSKPKHWMCYEFLLERLKHVTADHCEIWPFGTNQHGYGIVHLPDKTRTRAHRVAFKEMFGHYPKPMGLHTCDNPACFNPLHIVEGNQSDNMRDCAEKMRGNHGQNNGMSKLTADQVLEIRRLFLSGLRRAHIARLFGVNYVTIHDIVKRNAWKHVQLPT